MNELNKKLAEWAGFTEIIQLGSCLCGFSPGFTYNKNWTKPTVSIFPIPDFTESLDACFEWLVPRLITMNIVLRLGCSGDKHEIVWWASLLQHGEGEPYHFKEWYKSNGDTLVQSLCLAIEKLIEVGNG